MLMSCQGRVTGGRHVRSGSRATNTATAPSFVSEIDLTDWARRQWRPGTLRAPWAPMARAPPQLAFPPRDRGVCGQYHRPPKRIVHCADPSPPSDPCQVVC